MAARSTKRSTKHPTSNENGAMTKNQRQQFNQFMRRVIANQELSRAALAQFLAGPGFDVDSACGYPSEIPFANYRKLYEREGIATRVIAVYPSECWSVQPWVYETEAIEGKAETPFEKRWKELVDTSDIYTKLSRLDEISGIGHYGVLLIGTTGDLATPIEGIDRNGKTTGTPKQRELLYLVPFAEDEARITEWEKSESSIRYGKPVYYDLTLANPSGLATGATASSMQLKRVHWTRCIHVADCCMSSEIFGVPRLKKVYNYILNIRKIMGGSAEMFWHGGFPGTAYVVPPEWAGNTELDSESLKKELEEYYSGFKRYVGLRGVEPHQLSPNIANPAMHIDMQLKAISLSIEAPQRMLLGTEEARLASMQDSNNWNRRLRRRQELHLTPNFIRQFADRLIAMGIVPTPENGIYQVKWPDVYSVSETDRADITGKLVRALAEYIRSGATKMFPPLQFLTMIMDFSTEEAEEILTAAEEAVESGEFDFLDEVPVQPSNTVTRQKPLGESRKVRISGLELTLNQPAMRCQRGGKPGYKHGRGGKCFTYTPGDKDSQAKALRKAKLQGAAISIGKHLQNMELEDGEVNPSEC